MALSTTEKHAVGDMAKRASYILSSLRAKHKDAADFDVATEALSLAAQVMSFAKNYAAAEPAVEHILKEP